MLVIGCGTGLYTNALLDYGVGRFTLLDASSQMLEFERRKLRDATEKKIINDVLATSLPVIPFKNATFDAVMVNMVNLSRLVTKPIK